VAKSAPHIYLSALPFTPTCSPVSTHYSTSFFRTLHVERGQLSHWPSLETVISNFGEAVLSIAFSPDGQHLVSGSEDRTIRVWNAMTGDTVAGAFTGHTDPVNTVTFSPDGQHIVSGSNDRTIRVWNAITGETVAGPFTGHTGLVNSVAFSPDGQHLVSGSHDRTIRVSNFTIGKTELADDVDFTEHFVINDEGWVCGSKGELLMWIPSVHSQTRDHSQAYRKEIILDRNGRTTDATTVRCACLGQAHHLARIHFFFFEFVFRCIDLRTKRRSRHGRSIHGGQRV
jgi:WD40 repeat protein